MKTIQTTLITDDQSLVSAQFSHGTPIQTYDDGFGPLFIFRNSMGVQGIVRAQTWEDAYSIAEDELFDDCDLTEEEIEKEYGWREEKVTPYGSGMVSTERVIDPAAWPENPLFCESYGFRPNGLRHAHKPMSFIYSKDLNGESLDLLTPELVSELGIQLNTQPNE